MLLVLLDSCSIEQCDFGRFFMVQGYNSSPFPNPSWPVLFAKHDQLLKWKKKIDECEGLVAGSRVLKIRPTEFCKFVIFIIVLFQRLL